MPMLHIVRMLQGRHGGRIVRLLVALSAALLAAGIVLWGRG
jgi:hypothetical protein